MNGRQRVRVVRPWDWAAPPPPVEREVLAALPGTDTGRPPLLFVPDAGQAAACFAAHWLPHAAGRGFPAHAVSLRGHGGSGGAERRGRTLLRDYLHDVSQTAVGLPVRPVLIGHGLGAFVVARVLARYPARAAVLLTPAGPAAAVARVRREPRETLRSLVGRRGRAHLGRTDEPPLVQCHAALARPAGPPLGDPPVLVVGSRRDRTVPAADVARAARQYGTAPVWLDGVGHDLMLDAGWQAPLDAVLDWVERIQVRSTDRAGVDVRPAGGAGGA